MDEKRLYQLEKEKLAGKKRKVGSVGGKNFEEKTNGGQEELVKPTMSTGVVLVKKRKDLSQKDVHKDYSQEDLQTNEGASNEIDSSPLAALEALVHYDSDGECQRCDS